MSARLHDVDAALRQAAAWHAAGERLVLVRGGFDLLAPAHARAIAAAKSRASRVIVAVRDDMAAARVLGPGRPVMTAAERGPLVAALRGVDLVVVADDAAALALADAIGRVSEIVDADAAETSDVRRRVLELHGR